MIETRTKCDKCGEVISGWLDGAGHPVRKKGRGWSAAIAVTIDGTEIDLCDACYSDLCNQFRTYIINHESI